MSSSLALVHYKGFTLQAGAFHVPEDNRYLSSLVIVEANPECSDARRYKPKSASADGLFATAEEAIAAAIEHGKTVVDGNAQKPAYL